MHVVHVDIEANHELSVSSSYANLIEGMANSRLNLLTALTVKENFLIALTADCIITFDLTLESGSVVDLDQA